MRWLFWILAIAAVAVGLTLLARGNRPMSLSDLHYELTVRWATPSRPIVMTEQRLLRILDSDTYYGFARR